MMLLRVLYLLLTIVTTATAQIRPHGRASARQAGCQLYGYTSTSRRPPLTDGVYKLASMRPKEHCRTFRSQEVELAINETAAVIADPDLKRLFTNAFPNTLDTTVSWRGVSDDNEEEELAFIITGDIPAMWLRDSAQQLESYAPLLKGSNNNESLASLFRGAINLQARYLNMNPYCQAFQPPEESGRGPERNWAFSGQYTMTPPYDKTEVFECKWELDSFGAFLQLSNTYYTRTGDVAFFEKFKWAETVKLIMEVAENMTDQTSYNDDGSLLNSTYTFSEFLNGGLGSPLAGGTGLIKSFFRPSDDAAIYLFFIPGNMQFAHYLHESAEIMEKLNGEDGKKLAGRMRDKAAKVREAIEKHGVIPTKEHGYVYAYEVDGYGGAILMDDANSPSLLSSAYFGYSKKDDAIYRNTRARILSKYNPYWSWGPDLSVIGSPHSGMMNGWPMAAIMRILTSDDDAEITQQLYQLVSSTDGLGLIHESVNSHDQSKWTRSWFAWANGLFGQAVYDLKQRKPHILQQSFQDTERSKVDVGQLDYKPQDVNGPVPTRPAIPPMPVKAHAHGAEMEHSHDGDGGLGHAMGTGGLGDMTWFWCLAGGLAASSAVMVAFTWRSRRKPWIDVATGKQA